MEYVRAHGYPVPAIEELRAGGTELVMERVDGPNMITEMSRRPWTIGRSAELLAQLHQSLHRIAAPGWVPEAPGGDGDRLLHLDLHPLNVILAPAGPVVIDWPNAARGDGHADVALTWLLLASGANPAKRLVAMVSEPFRARLVRAFLTPFDREALRGFLPDVAAWKMTDPNMTEGELAAMRALLQNER